MVKRGYVGTSTDWERKTLCYLALPEACRMVLLDTHKSEERAWNPHGWITAEDKHQVKVNRRRHCDFARWLVVDDLC